MVVCVNKTKNQVCFRNITCFEILRTHRRLLLIMSVLMSDAQALAARDPAIDAFPQTLGELKISRHEKDLHDAIATCNSLEQELPQVWKIVTAELYSALQDYRDPMHIQKLTEAVVELRKFSHLRPGIDLHPILLQKARALQKKVALLYHTGMVLNLLRDKSNFGDDPMFPIAGPMADAIDTVEWLRG